MSTAQLAQAQKTKTATGVTSEQSQKLIQTMLTMSFGCVAFLRGLFADDYFVDQRFVPAKFEKDYDQDQKSKAESIRVKTLVRGRSSQVDLFLDWIDKGATDAIRRGYLKSLSFAIFLEKENPQSLHEAYTFCFDYHDNKVKIDINDNEETISLLNSRRVLQQLMRRFIIITQSLDPLPEEKYMSMRMLFNDNCPGDYQPPFFKDASTEPISTVKAKAGTDGYTAGNLSTGYHNINLKIMTASASVSSNDVFQEVDPFDFATSMFVEPKHVTKDAMLALHSKSTTEEPSQTTNMLRSFLESSQPDTGPTQVLTSISCECGSVEEIISCSTADCAMCGKKVHSFCYGLGKTKTIVNCFSCRSKSFSGVVQLHKNLKALMNIRKLYKIFTKVGIPSSVTALHKLMGFGVDLKVKVTADSLSFGLIRGLLILNQTPLRTKYPKSTTEEFRAGSAYFDVDVTGVLSVDYKEIKKGHYGLTFVPGLRGPDIIQLRAVSTRAKKLIFEDTMGKCLNVDDILNKITASPEDYYEKEDDIIDSSPISNSPTKSYFGVEDHFSNLNLQSAEDYVKSTASSAPIATGASRKRDSTVIESDTIKQDEYYTSQPVITHPRLKRRKGAHSDVLVAANYR